MPPAAIPPRQPIEDHFSGVLIEANQQRALTAAPIENSIVLAQGDFTIRYGIRYLGKPHLSIVPGLVVVDYGQMLNGEAGWNFLINRSNLYPRAEVFGFRNDGRDEMIYIKNLDLALPIMVLVYADDQANKPIGDTVALVGSGADSTPERLRRYLLHFETLEAWLAASS